VRGAGLHEVAEERWLRTWVPDWNVPSRDSGRARYSNNIKWSCMDSSDDVEHEDSEGTIAGKRQPLIGHGVVTPADVLLVYASMVGPVDAGDIDTSVVPAGIGRSYISRPPRLGCTADALSPSDDFAPMLRTTAIVSLMLVRSGP